MQNRESRFIVSGLKPFYLHAAVRSSLDARVEAARRELAACRACPRRCVVNRLDNETGVCGVGRHARVVSAGPHFGEEDCLRGQHGSGTIFFSYCNLQCVFCQNWEISQRGIGKELHAGELANLMIGLQEEGCHNVNLVTPEHVVPQVIEALAIAIDRGLTLPIVYNTSAYDSVASLKLLDGLVDIYMPDFKFWSTESAGRLCGAEDYPVRAREAIAEMHRQVGDLCFTSDGIACRGLLVRHLLMPGLHYEAQAIFRWLASEISPDTYVNVMTQYHPDHLVPRLEDAAETDGGGVQPYRDINRRPTAAEIKEAHRAAREAGLWRFDARRSQTGP